MLQSIDREEVASGRLRRYYRLTDRGRTELSAAALRQRAQAETALKRLGTNDLGWSPS